MLEICRKLCYNHIIQNYSACVVYKRNDLRLSERSGFQSAVTLPCEACSRLCWQWCNLL